MTLEYQSCSIELIVVYGARDSLLIFTAKWKLRIPPFFCNHLYKELFFNNFFKSISSGEVSNISNKAFTLLPEQYLTSK